MVKRKFLVLGLAVTLLMSGGSVYASPVDLSVSDNSDVTVSEASVTSKIIGADGLKLGGTKTYPKGTVITGEMLLANLVVTDLDGKDIGSKEKIIFFNGKGKEFTANAYAEVINTELKNGAAKSYVSCFIPYGGNFDFKIAYSDVTQVVPAGLTGNPAFEIPANSDITGDLLKNHFTVVDLEGKDLGMKDKVRFLSSDGRILTPDTQAQLLINAFKSDVTVIVPVVAFIEGYPDLTCKANILLGQVVEKPSISYTTHVQDFGWQKKVSDGTMAGTEGKSKRLEGITIESGIDGVGVEYRTHVENIGWQPYVADGKTAGTEGKSYRLEAINIRLTGENASKYDVYYRVHAQNVGWMGWASNDAPAGTAGYSYRLEGIEIKIVDKGAEAPGSTANAFVENK